MLHVSTHGRQKVREETTMRVKMWHINRKWGLLVWAAQTRLCRGGGVQEVSSYDWGRCCLIISFDWGGILSGKRTENSTMRSPRCDGFLGKGKPSPLSRFTVPGLMMSWQGREMMRFSSVGMLTVQPHNAWKGGRLRGLMSLVRIRCQSPDYLHDFMFPWQTFSLSSLCTSSLSSTCFLCVCLRVCVGVRKRLSFQTILESSTAAWGLQISMTNTVKHDMSVERFSCPYVCVCAGVCLCMCQCWGGTHCAGD